MSLAKTILISAFLVGGQINVSAQGPLPPPPQVYINEIMYNPPEAGADSLEFIELFTVAAADFSLHGYYFSSGIDFSFPINAMAQNQGFVLIAKDSVAFENAFGIQAYQWSGSSSLLNTGEAIVIEYQNYGAMDSVAYDEISPWPEQANGGGASIVYCNYPYDNTAPSHWQASQNNTGVVVNGMTIYADPGQASVCMTVGFDEQKESEAISIYPNPATTNLTVESRTPLAQVWVSDVAGRRVITHTLNQAHDNAVIDVSALPRGIYLVEAITEDGQRSVQKVMVE